MRTIQVWGASPRGLFVGLLRHPPISRSVGPWLCRFAPPGVLAETHEKTGGLLRPEPTLLIPSPRMKAFLLSGSRPPRMAVRSAPRLLVS